MAAKTMAPAIHPVRELMATARRSVDDPLRSRLRRNHSSRGSCHWGRASDALSGGSAASCRSGKGSWPGRERIATVICMLGWLPRVLTDSSRIPEVFSKAMGGSRAAELGCVICTSHSVVLHSTCTASS
jgi:hypothetical protein